MKPLVTPTPEQSAVIREIQRIICKRAGVKQRCMTKSLPKNRLHTRARWFAIYLASRTTGLPAAAIARVFKIAECGVFSARQLFAFKIGRKPQLGSIAERIIEQAKRNANANHPKNSC